MQHEPSGGWDVVMEKNKKVGSALNAVQIIKYLIQSGAPRRLVDISKSLSINNSTCLGIIKTLESEGFVSKSGGKTYEIGPELLSISLRFSGHGNVTPILDQISARHGVSALYWRRFGDEQLVLTACSHPQVGANIYATLGMRIPLLTGSMGRCIAGSGEFSREHLERLFSETVWQMPLTFEEFLEEAEEAKRRGWSEEKGRYLEGVNAVSVPVPSPDNRIIRLVSVFGFDQTLPVDMLPIVAHDLRRAAELISIERDRSA